MKTARVGKTEVGGISCVFLDTNSRILHPVTVSGHLAAVSLSSVGLQIWDEQVLQSVRALTGRRTGEVLRPPPEVRKSVKRDEHDER